MTGSPPTKISPLRPTCVLIAIVGLGVLLRGYEAWHKSLWVDEVHTVDVAWSSSAAEVVQRIRPDFHAPLYFLAIHGLGHVDPHPARGASFLVGLLTLFPLLSLCRSVGMGTRGQLLTAAAFAFLPFQIQYGTELRPYAWLQLTSVLLVWAAFTSNTTRSLRFLTFVVATAVGLYTHYLTCVVVLAIGSVRLFVRPPSLLPTRTVVAAGTLGVCLFLPWILTTESWIFSDPGVMWRDEHAVTGTPAASPAPSPKPLGNLREDLLALPARLAVPMMNRLGNPHDQLMMIAGLSALGLVVGAGGVRLLRRGPGRLSGPLAVALLATAILVFLSWRLWNRIALQYFAIAAWSWPMVIGWSFDRLGGRLSHLAAWTLAGLLFVLGAAHATGEPREDFPSALGQARRVAGETPVLFTSIMRQPPHYSHRRVFEIYAPDLKAVEPSEVPIPSSDAPGPRIVVLSRASSPDDPASWHNLWRHVGTGRRLTGHWIIDHALQVWTFDPIP